MNRVHALPKKPEPDWRDQLIRNAHGKPKAFLANAILALRLAPEWRGLLQANEFSLETIASRPTPWEDDVVKFAPRPWTSRDDTLTANWLQRAEIPVSVETVEKAVEAVAGDNQVHPIRDYLNGLRWDGKRRLDGWLSTYLGAEASPIVSAVGQRTLIGAVARILSPGCKVDTMLILEGEQGAGKSQAIGILGGEWFSDELGDFGSKDAAMQTRAAWIIEIAELNSLTKAEAVTIKSFLSRKTDIFRPPYGARIIKSPRQSVFIGTTNAYNYLKDETGARRFWPVKVGEIRLADLKRDRDQWFAEAVHAYLAGAPWWLDTAELADLAAVEQEQRFLGDVWEDTIASFLIGRDEVTMPDILANGLGVEVARQGKSEQTRVGGILRALGWVRERAGSGTRGYVYRRRPT